MKDAVEQVIAVLKRPLSDEERRAGWRSDVKDGYVPVFTKLLGQIERGEDLSCFGIVRSLDAYGIGAGPLHDMMLRVASEANARHR